MVWNLGTIREATRQLTGRLSSAEMSNSMLDTRINDYLQYTLPAELKLDYEYTYYEFLTSGFQPTYTVPVEWVDFDLAATMDRQKLEWYQDPNTFYQSNPEQINRSTPWTGDGTTTAFTTTLAATNYPIMPNTLVITDNTETFEDTNETYTSSNVAITGDLGGTAAINYSTGVVTVTFNTAPTDGQIIYLSLAKMVTGKPNAVLFYNKQFRFFPIPDTAYRFRVQGYKTFTAFASSSSEPPLQQWGRLIVYGTAKDIHAEYAETQALQEVTMLHEDQLKKTLARTYSMLDNERSMPQF